MESFRKKNTSEKENIKAKAAFYQVLKKDGEINIRQSQLNMAMTLEILGEVRISMVFISNDTIEAAIAMGKKSC